MGRTIVRMDRPIYAGFAILDISKTLMYRFHYDFMKRNIPSVCLKLNYIDTDSFILEIRNHDVYKFINYHQKEAFDTSSYPIDNRYGIPLSNKKVLGMM